ncbi:MAG: hypothetical protein ACR2G3_02000 [Solirubrobacterales bacterium]
MLLIALLGVPTASASVVRSGGFRYVTKSYELAPGKARTFKAPCPDGTHVTGGGHYNNGGFGDVIGAHSFPYDSDDRRRKPDDGWKAQLRGFGTTWDASVYAICSRLVPEYVQEPYSVDPGFQTEAGPVCGLSSLHPLGGGTTGHPSAVEVTSRPVNFMGTEYWEGGVRNKSQQPQEGKIIGACANLEVQYRFAVSGTVAPGTQVAQNVFCPVEAPHVVGGGFNVSGASDRATAATRPFGFGPADDGWQVWVDNYDDESFTFVARVSCVPAL